MFKEYSKYRVYVQKRRKFQKMFEDYKPYKIPTHRLYSQLLISLYKD